MTATAQQQRRRGQRQHRSVVGGGALGVFMVSVLHQLGAPITAANLGFLYAWARREGAGGAYNPLNTTLAMPGASSMNGVGVKNYTSWQQGARATARTLSSSYYSDVVAALRSGHASTTTSYAGLSKWSGGGYSNLAGISTSPYVLYGGPAGTNPVGKVHGTGPTGQPPTAGAGGAVQPAGFSWSWLDPLHWITAPLQAGEEAVITTVEKVTLYSLAVVLGVGLILVGADHAFQLRQKAEDVAEPIARTAGDAGMVAAA